MIIKSKKSRVSDITNYTILTLLAIITIYPFWTSIVISIIPLKEYLSSNIHLWPKTIDLSAYKFMLGMEELWHSFGVTIFVTLIGTAINILLTIMTAYALSKKDLKGGRVIMFLIVFTMMFNGGLIPTYIVVQKLGLMNTLWALIIPGAIGTFNLIIMKNFFAALPSSLEEAAQIEGYNDIQILFKIIVPISMPAIATIALFYSVEHWNEFFSAVMYITDRNKWPLQLFLRSMLFENGASTTAGGGDDPYLLGMPIKMAAIMITALPILCMYPFFQKYFVKGIMIGGVKG